MTRNKATASDYFLLVCIVLGALIAAIDIAVRGGVLDAAG